MVCRLAYRRSEKMVKLFCAGKKWGFVMFVCWSRPFGVILSDGKHHSLFCGKETLGRIDFYTLCILLLTIAVTRKTAAQ